MSNAAINPAVAKACPVTNEDDMAAFDRLPPSIRALVREAPINMATPPLLDYQRKLGTEPLERLIAKHLAEVIRPRLAAELQQALER